MRKSVSCRLISSRYISAATAAIASSEKSRATTASVLRGRAGAGAGARVGAGVAAAGLVVGSVVSFTVGFDPRLFDLRQCLKRGRRAGIGRNDHPCEVECGRLLGDAGAGYDHGALLQLRQRRPRCQTREI